MYTVETCYKRYHCETCLAIRDGTFYQFYVKHAYFYVVPRNKRWQLLRQMCCVDRDSTAVGYGLQLM